MHTLAKRHIIVQNFWGYKTRLNLGRIRKFGWETYGCWPTLKDARISAKAYSSLCVIRSLLISSKLGWCRKLSQRNHTGKSPSVQPRYQPSGRAQELLSIWFTWKYTRPRFTSLLQGRVRMAWSTTTLTLNRNSVSNNHCKFLLSIISFKVFLGVKLHSFLTKKAQILIKYLLPIGCWERINLLTPFHPRKLSGREL